MRFSNIALAASAAGVASAANSSTSVCDKYTTALLKDNTAANQYTLLTLLVNTVVIGNYTKPNTGVMVPGILAAGKVNNTEVNLAPYFTGALASSNRNNMAVAINFLDGGAAEPLKKNMPANDNSSNQYFLLTHLYQFFGSLLGCSQQGMTGFDAYMGQASMYEVHKFMDLNYAEVTYFIEQVALAAASFGVEKSDIETVGMALGGLFNVACAPAETAIKAQGAQLQSICIDQSTCPKAPNADCAKYAAAVMPMNATSTMSGVAGSTGTMMASGTASGTMMASGTAMASGTSTPSSVSHSGAATKGFSLAAAVAAIAAFAL